MKPIKLNRLLILIIVISLLVIDCTKQEEKNNYIFSGRVIDQVSKKPVSGATIRYGHKRFNEGDQPVTGMPQSALSRADGRYRLVVPKETFDDKIRNPGPVIFANKYDYVGSNVLNAPNGGEIIDLELYHSAELQLHVKNDTISNQIDETLVWFIGNSAFWKYPGFIGRVVQARFPLVNYTCKGRDFDTVIIIKPLWGNLTYSIRGGKDYFLGPYYSSSSIQLIPDTINYLSVTF